LKKIVIIVLLTLSFSGTLFCFWNGYPLNYYEAEVNDARSEALGRTSILSSSKANFTFNNPAMLGILTEKNIQVGLRLITGKTIIKKKDDNEESTYNYENPIHLKLNSFSVSVPYKSNMPNIGFGVGYRTYYDRGMNLKYELDSNTTIMKRHGGLSTLVIGVGVNSDNKYNIGFSYSLPLLSNTSRERIVDGELRSEFEGTMKGSFFTLGGSYRLNKRVLIGARFRTKFDLEVKEKELSDDEIDIDEITIPTEIGLAIEVSPKDNLVIYIEYLSRKFSHLDVNDFGIGNGFSIRSGFEFDKNILYRGGFFIQSVPIYNPISTSEWSSNPETEIGFTTGLGLELIPHLSLDLYGSYSFLNYENSIEIDYRYIITSDYYFSQIKLGCSLGYAF